MAGHRLGTVRVMLFDHKMHQEILETITLESELRQAVARRELLLHYQPIVSVHTRALEGFEALVRWNHPHRGIIPPARFIPLAEETGLILPIGRFVMSAEEALNYLRLVGAEIDNIYYVYVIRGDETPLGVVTLKRLLLSPPKTPVAEIMSQWSQSPLPAATTVSVLTTFATKARTSKSTTSRVICWASILEKSRISFKMPRSCLAESRTVSR